MSEPALMTVPEVASPHVVPSANPMRWRIAVLVSAAIAISYLDRQTLPWAITAIQRDIPISNEIKAFLDSAFLVTYGLMYLGGGRLEDRRQHPLDREDAVAFPRPSALRMPALYPCPVGDCPRR